MEVLTKMSKPKPCRVQASYDLQLSYLPKENLRSVDAGTGMESKFYGRRAEGELIFIAIRQMIGFLKKKMI